MYEVTILLPIEVHYQLRKEGYIDIPDRFIIIVNTYTEKANNSDSFLEIDYECHIRLCKKFYFSTWTCSYEGINSASGMGVLINRKYILKVKEPMMIKLDSPELKELEDQKKHQQSKSNNNILLLIARKRNG